MVNCKKQTKDGRTVKQFLIDSYAAAHREEEPASSEGKVEDEYELKRSVQDVRKGKKYTTPFWEQLWVLSQRTFKQRRAEILCFRQVVQFVALAVLSGLLWLRLDKDGAVLSLLHSLLWTALLTPSDLSSERTISDRNGFLFFTYGPSTRDELSGGKSTYQVLSLSPIQHHAMAAHPLV